MEKGRKTALKSIDLKNVNDDQLNGVYGELAELIGIEAAMCLYENYRGQQVTFPVNFFSRAFLRTKILSEYNGHNVKHLATRYGYSEKTIRKILREEE